MSKTTTNLKDVLHHKIYVLCISDPCYYLRAQNSWLTWCKSVNKALFRKPQKSMESTFTQGFSNVSKTAFDCVVTLATLVQEATHPNYISVSLALYNFNIFLTWSSYFEKKVAFYQYGKEGLQKKKLFTETIKSLE